MRKPSKICKHKQGYSVKGWILTKDFENNEYAAIITQCKKCKDIMIVKERL